ncbi:MAG TPA: polysaccharide biosynthesis/export family protein [Vicinamibacterales bacterium]|jgi:polysaccharide export outer membrane protein|nr:polysaccharide biosynthesis/export family protein [Vicinamibacterales bacterium]
MNYRFVVSTVALLALSASASAQDVGNAAKTPMAAGTPAVNAASETTSNIENAIINSSKDYRIGPEDLLDISVWKNPELSRTVPVRPDGKVSLPLVNDIQAAGLTPTDLRLQLTQKFSEYIPAPEVAVIVREVHSVKVAVVGSVKTPGRYELKSPATVLELIALAQGLTDFASRDRIVILRQTNGMATRIPFNYRKVAAGDDQANLVVQPGDIIVVP